MNYDTFQVRIPRSLVGNGAIENLGTEAKKLGAKKVLIVTDEGIAQTDMADKLKATLEKEKIEVGIFDGCQADVPLEAVGNCAKFAREGNYDLLVGLGGGSVMDTTKVACIMATLEGVVHEEMYQYLTNVKQRGLPKILVPTTAGTGAEWNFGAVITDEFHGGVKRAIRNESQLAELTIIDPLLTLNLPPRITADTGMDALTHAMEAYTMLRVNLISEVLSEKAIKLIANNLRAAHGDGSRNIEARYNMSLASAIACMSMIMAGGAQLSHGMGHALQVKAHSTHGVTVSILTPYVMEYSMLANLPRFAHLSELMGERVENLSLRDAAQRAVDAVRQLSLDIGMPQRLRDIGIKKEDIPDFVELVFTTQARAVTNNARQASRDDVRRLYEAAW